jgi:hypothetical protein
LSFGRGNDKKERSNPFLSVIPVHNYAIPARAKKRIHAHPFIIPAQAGIQTIPSLRTKYGNPNLFVISYTKKRYMHALHHSISHFVILSFPSVIYTQAKKRIPAPHYVIPATKRQVSAGNAYREGRRESKPFRHCEQSTAIQIFADKARRRDILKHTHE